MCTQGCQPHSSRCWFRVPTPRYGMRNASTSELALLEQSVVAPAASTRDTAGKTFRRHFYVDDCPGPFGIGFAGLSKTRAAYATMAKLIRQHDASQKTATTEDWAQRTGKALKISRVDQ